MLQYRAADDTHTHEDIVDNVYRLSCSGAHNLNLVRPPSREARQQQQQVTKTLQFHVHCTILGFKNINNS